MFGTMPLPALIGAFVAAGAAVWIAGIQLSAKTDVLATRLGLGEALGGLILLAIATDLPEIAITGSAALSHSYGIAIGNLLGGVAIQTVVLVALDAFGPGDEPLTYRAASLPLVLEGLLVIALMVIVVMATRLPSDAVALRLSPGSVSLAVVWVAGLWLIGKARKGLPWHEEGQAPGGQEEPAGHSQRKRESDASRRGESTARAAMVFGAAALVTLVAGVVLERSGEQLASRLHMTGVLFGATVLAGATSLPELSTGLASVKLGDDQLAFSDIFGGNAVLPVLFLEATLLSGDAVLPRAQNTDVYLTALGALLTAVYLYGLIFRPRRRVLGMGVDSAVVLALYALGVVGLVAVARG
jgi:cation:H+ antiporter